MLSINQGDTLFPFDEQAVLRVFDEIDVDKGGSISANEMSEKTKDKHFMKMIRGSRNAPLIQLMNDAREDPEGVEKSFLKALAASRKKRKKSKVKDEKAKIDDEEDEHAKKDEVEVVPVEVEVVPASESDEITKEDWLEFMGIKRFQRLLFYRGKLLSNACTYYGLGMDVGRIKAIWYVGPIPLLPPPPLLALPFWFSCSHVNSLPCFIPCFISRQPPGILASSSRNLT